MFVLHIQIDLRDLRISTLIGIIMLGYRTLPRRKIESPEVYLDRFRKICQRAIRSGNSPVELTDSD